MYSEGELARFADGLVLCTSIKVTGMSLRIGIGEAVGEDRYGSFQGAT